MIPVVSTLRRRKEARAAAEAAEKAEVGEWMNALSAFLDTPKAYAGGRVDEPEPQATEPAEATEADAQPPARLHIVA